MVVHQFLHALKELHIRGGRELENFLMSQAELFAIWRVKSSHELSNDIVQ